MEEMSELFYRDPYMREFSARVISCVPGKKGYEVELDDTAFYPEGGGQPADHGTLDGVRVTDVRRKNGVILHLCEAPLEAGSEVHGVIDWQRRFDHMQNHTGEHIVSGLIHRNYGYENVGFHMGEIILLDFDGEVTFEMMRFIEQEANRRIWQNIPVRELFPSDEELKQIDYRSKKELSGKVRIIDIEDSDTCACCGTHLKHTGEVGVIHLLSAEKHGSGTRIEMLAGERALRYLEKVADENTKISHMLSAKPLATSDAVKRLSDANTKQSVRTGKILREWIALKVSSLEDSDGLVVLAEEWLEGDAMRYLCNAVLENGKASTAVILSGEQEESCRYLIGTRTRRLREDCRKLNALLKGKGGGKDEMVQGTFGASASEAEACVREVLL